MLCIAAIVGNGVVRAVDYLINGSQSSDDTEAYQQYLQHDAAGLSDLDNKLEQIAVHIDRLKGKVDELNSGKMDKAYKKKIQKLVKKEGLADYLNTTDGEFSDSEIPDLEDTSKSDHHNGIINGSDQSVSLSDIDDARTPHFSEDENYMIPYERATSSISAISSTAHILGSVQTREIKATWTLILSDLQSVGVQCVVDLFELHPFVKEHFRSILSNYAGLDPDDYNVLQNILENHAKLIMNVVHDLVMHIDEIDIMADRLAKLGMFHLKNGVPKEYLDIMGPIFCNATRPILLKKGVWNYDVENSWMELFKMLTNMMKKSYEVNEAIPQQLWLNPTEKCIIVATWHSIFLKHVDQMGQQLFVDLIKADANVLKYFEAFRDVGVTNMLHNRALAKHGTRVMNLVRFAVENLDNPEKLQDHMLMLGRLHVKKGIDRQFLDLMGPTFCQAIRPMVMSEGSWSLDIDGAWSTLFRILVQMMSKAYDGKELGGRFPSMYQANLILDSWKQLEESLEEIGFQTFTKLFESHANIKNYFPKMKKLSAADIELSRDIADHSKRVMGIVRLFVNNIHNLESIEGRLEDLGRSHFGRGIKSEYLEVMGPVFCNTIRPILVRKNLWNIELEEVYLSMFKKVSDLMKRGYPKEKRKTSKLLKAR